MDVISKFKVMKKVFILEGIPKLGCSEYVFPAVRANGSYQGTAKVWAKVRQRAGLQSVRLHDLRHSFASVAAAGGVSMQVIGGLLGHSDVSTTSRYAHLSATPMRNAAEAIGNELMTRIEFRASLNGKEK